MATSKQYEYGGMGEIAAAIGVTKQRVQQWTAEPEFPPPVGHLGGRYWIWHLPTAIAWCERRQVLNRPAVRRNAAAKAPKK